MPSEFYRNLSEIEHLILDAKTNVIKDYCLYLSEYFPQLSISIFKTINLLLQSENTPFDLVMIEAQLIRVIDRNPELTNLPNEDPNITRVKLFEIFQKIRVRAFYIHLLYGPIEIGKDGIKKGTPLDNEYIYQKPTSKLIEH